MLWLCEAKIWRKCKNILNRFRELYSLHQNRRNLRRYYKKIYTSIYELERQLPEGKYKKVIGLMKELSWKIMKELSALKPKTYSYLKDNNNENKKSKGHKKVCHKT